MPAAFTTSDGTIIRANEAAQSLFSGSSLIVSLRTAIIDARLAGRIQIVRIHTAGHPGEENKRRFDITLVPVPPSYMLVLAKDNTLEANLVNALAASRQLFRDLALCSNDFAFETDALAHFTYTSPAGFLGYSARELHGTRPRSFFTNAGVASLFSVKTPVQSEEVWTTDKSGKDACIVVTAVPMQDADGAWCGARGAVRNLTKLRLQEQQVEHARAREELLSAVVTAMRAQVEPRRMMLAAVDALCAATASDHAMIQSTDARMNTSIGAASLTSNRLEYATTYHGQTNGCVAVSRRDGESLYQDNERKLLESVVPHLGIAIALASLLKSRNSSEMQGT
ncbi:MAG: PAS domain-containing protein [Micropepsaceae bacterium]